jgi:hypothetical protein
LQPGAIWIGRGRVGSNRELLLGAARHGHRRHPLWRSKVDALYFVIEVLYY